jgi:two-component system OmpR family sensor kinase
MFERGRQQHSLHRSLAIWMAASTIFTLAAFAGALYLALRVEEVSKLRERSEESGAFTEQASEQMLLAMAVGGPLALLVAVGGAVVLSRRALAPLEAVIEGARRITASRLDERLALPDRRDELYVLVEEFNRLFSRLEQGFSALSRYAADASHELRTPLTVVASELEVALRHPRTPAEWERSAEKSLGEIRQLARLVDSLLALARAEGPLQRLIRLDLREQVDQVLASASERASAKGLFLSPAAEGGNDPALVDGDPDALSTVVRNLVDNALNYTPSGGHVQVAVRQIDGEIQVAVEDSGPGVAKQDREAIFSPWTRRPFDSPDQGTEGHGLGLAIARRIVERHGGDLSVDDANGGGARFLIRVPATLPAPTRAPSGEPAR